MDRTQWQVTADNPSTASNDSCLTTYNKPNSRLYWLTQTGVVVNQPSQWGYIVDIGNGQERHQIFMVQPHGNLYHRGGNGSDWGGSWKCILDSSNYTSYCAPVSHSHSYLPLGGGTVTGTLNIENHTQNGTYDTLLRVSHHSNNEWGVVIDKGGSYDWGLKIDCGQGNNGLALNGGLLMYNNIGYGSTLPSSPAVGRVFFKT